ncbi:hypothetical protein SmJEL517_g02425 [Synchytrium microbalum]|uniref:DUF4200 domain-containing protein n=1 Tax=Synchytrium microbalum TaxID=1806994 RepID=A0A507CAL7_9FUNG|nr:uncharacterized protein SmJEL517_g02425 [Synchytrium microbalum]TPX35034.1 hypothetical protein SmJEL517_g02425 [Synchytrium microbalum]
MASVNPFKLPSSPAMVEALMSKQTKSGKRDMASKKETQRKNFKRLLMEETQDASLLKKIQARGIDEIALERKGPVDGQFGKESLRDFIAKKREMFLVQYALGVKREEMRKLEEMAQSEEEKLMDDEKALEEDAAKFDAFLKENDKNSVEAIKRAEVETKAKLEKIQEIKKLNVQIMSIRSEMSKNEDQLKDLQRYKQFLDQLTPKDFSGDSKTKSPKNTDGSISAGGEAADEAVDDSTQLEEDEAPLYFETPQQLLDIFAELEENNLALIQNCQETEETLEDLKRKISETEGRMEDETQSLKQQIRLLEESIEKEEEKARVLEERSKMFSIGGVGGESQDKILDELNHKVKEVYKKCVGDGDSNLGTLQMLTNIENKLEYLFETIEMMPPDKVEQAEKIKEKERRQRLREEKMEAQRALQEERVQKALERAQAPVQKKTAKQVMFRSAPPQRKKKRELQTKKQEEEDEEYFWS